MKIIDGGTTVETQQFAVYKWNPRAAMRYHQTCFVLENLALAGNITWLQAQEARLNLPTTLGWDGATNLTWADGRPASACRTSLTLQAPLVCASCGSFCGQKVWHSTSPHRAEVWECQYNGQL
ncbi:hypothetical protein FYJ24_06005 [Actinomycetaceae bacterium WB03_NA08]|uniref:Uncharacterized protein n=2 Tax=Scrofimicrobium canadense TaxID=2652290 RepID=A0A6N7VRE2_9ACTO|nr:hypothetical protein [Scrofimicrobium canadense]